LQTTKIKTAFLNRY